jgi:hypothetical protein
LAALLVAPAAADEAKPQSIGDTQIATLIGELDSDRYQVREEASQQLLAVGVAALDPLLAAANGDRPEPADRAVWILRKIGTSEDRQVALAALDRLVRLKGRPAVVAEARLAQSRLRELACQEMLARLGGRLTILGPTLGITPQEIGQIRVIRVELGDEWRGTPDDLKCLASLDQHQYFRFVGSAVGDAEIKLFESKENLLLLQVFNSRVTPDAVDSLKQHQPKAIVYVRNRALLGISGESNPDGVLVARVENGTGAAAAGIAMGDVIMKIDGKPLKDFDRLTALIAQHVPGDQVDVTILRGKEVLTKRATLGDQPPEVN